MELIFHKHVTAPRALVFDRATDFAGAPARIQAIRKVEMLTPGPVRVGTQFKETRVVFKREAPWATLDHSLAIVPMRKNVEGFVQSPLGDFTFENVDIAE